MKSLAVLALLLAAAPALGETRRIAVVVGNNAGNPGINPLHFAEADAGKVARVLLELGQIGQDDLFLLQGRTEAEVEAAINLAQARIAEWHRTPDSRIMMLFYYSGHSDGEALELGEDRLPYPQLKSLLAASGADLRVTIIDSCQSGAALLHKGGKAAPGFTLRLADDLSTTGEAVLASSAADEVALESRELQGSYFTSAFISGLRGAADTSGDRQITLAEAYRYAYDHTVSATAQTLEGAQHPVYDFRLSGQGELVLSSLVRPSASIVLPEHLDRALVTDVTRDQVVAELLPGSARWLALAPGSYAVRAFREGKAFGTRFQLAEGESRTVAWEDLDPLSAPRVAAKGPTPAPVVVQTADAPTVDTSEPVLIGVSLGVSRGVADGLGPTGALRITFEPSGSTGLGLAVIASTGSNAEVAESGVHIRLGYHLGWAPVPVVVLSGGLEAGGGLIWQSVVGGSTGYTPVATAGPRVAARVGIVGPLFANLELELPVALLEVNQSASFQLLPAATLGLALQL